MAGDLVISTINGGAIGAKNTIINGNFGINQRGVSGTVTLSAGAYGHDRWKAGAAGCTYTFATSNNVTTITITAGSLMQVIEGINLQSGTHTLSWAGTAQGRVDAGSYAGSGLTGTAVGGTNQTVEFGTGTLSLVQYEAGSVATPFERRQYGQELALCQRYFQIVGGTSTEHFAPGVMSANRINIVYSFKQTMRAAPSWTATDFGSAYSNLTIFNSISSLAVTGTSENYSAPNAISIGFTHGGSTTAGTAGYIYFNSTAARVAFSAEL